MTVLACIDRSQYAASVCDHAMWASQHMNGEAVKLIHVIERHLEMTASKDHSGRLGVDTSESLLRELVKIDEQRNRLAQQRGRSLLDDAAHRLKTAGVIQISQRLLHGELVDHLTEQEADASLVVVGKRGEAAHQASEHLGGNLERVIRASYRPVLVAPQTFQPIRRFLFAHDGGKSSGRAINFLIESGLLQGVEGLLLFVGEGTDAERTRLADAADHLRAAGVSVSQNLWPGNAAEVIVNAVEREDVDLLVMGAYGHSHIRNLIIGSTTTEVMQTCTVPMLVCR